jgi:hypothetical protein
MVQNFETFNERVTFNKSPKRLLTKVTVLLKEWLSSKTFWLKYPCSWHVHLSFLCPNGWSIRLSPTLLSSQNQRGFQTFDKRNDSHRCWIHILSRNDLIITLAPERPTHLLASSPVVGFADFLGLVSTLSNFFASFLRNLFALLHVLGAAHLPVRAKLFEKK